MSLPVPSLSVPPFESLLSTGDTEPSAPERRPRILIADDDFDVRDMLTHLFERDGFEVQVASDGDMLVRLLDEDHRRGADPDVLLLDHRMPFYTGLEVLDGLRVWGFHKPAVMITAFGELVRDANALGATVLEKPFDPDTLRRMVFDRVGWADRLLDISAETEREVVEVRCASCGRSQRLVADEVRVNPPTFFCLECRERAAPLSDDELGEGD